MAETEAAHGPWGCPVRFLIKTYDMVDDPSTNAIVSWSPTSDTSFVVWNPPDFSRDLLPKYFKHKNFSSFIRQLNTYGFKKVDPDRWEFGNDDFLRGRREFLYKIQRRKSVFIRSPHNQVNNLGQLTEQERQQLEVQIENLKRDNNVLMNELQNHMQHSNGMEHQMQSLDEKLHTLELHQRRMVIFLSKMIQRPGCLTNFLQQYDLQSKKRRLPKDSSFIEDAVMEDNNIIYLKTHMSENSDTLHSLDMEPLEKMESSLNSLENFFRSVSQASGDDMYYDDTVTCLPSSVIITEMNALSGETDVDLQSSALKLHSSSCLKDVCSFPEIAESPTREENPAIYVKEIHTDARSKISEIDVNSEPAVAIIHSSSDQTIPAVTSTMPTGANDVFWEQFLTETPGPTQDIQMRKTVQKI